MCLYRLQGTQCQNTLRWISYAASPRHLRITPWSYSVQYIGPEEWLLADAGIKTETAKVESVKNFPVPHNIKKVQMFLGLAATYQGLPQSTYRLPGSIQRKTVHFKPYEGFFFFLGTTAIRTFLQLQDTQDS
ncbi:hypothetical protein MHYP_G00215880 [Metynnis hypsauchen]